MSAWSFGELRSLLQQTPSMARWDDLCALLDECEHPGKAQEASAYALAQLERWPPQLRRLPGRWLHRALREDDLRGLELVRVIELEPSFGRVEALFERLESLPSPPRLHAFRCAQHALNPALIARLARGVSFASLEALSIVHGQEPARDDVSDDAGGDALVAALGDEPLRLRALTLEGIRGGDDAWSALASAPAFSALERLSLSGSSFDDHALERWLSGSNHEGLRALNLSETAISAQGLTRCLSPASLPRLSELKLWGILAAGGDAMAIALGSSGSTRALEHLSLEATGLSDAGLELLLREPAWTHALTTLKLGYNALGPQSLNALFSASLPKLRRLTLNDTHVHMAHREERSEGALPRLEEINFERSGLSADALKGILQRAPRLHTLSLGQNPITDEGIAHLRAHPTPLRGLKIAHAQLSTQALEQALGGEGALKALHALDLSHNGLDDALINAFIKRDAGLHMERLDLSYNQLTSEALVGLALSPMPALTSLELAGNPIHDHGIIAFVSSESARRLKRLRFGPRRWSMAAVHAISASKMLRRLEELDLDVSQLPYELRQRLSWAHHLPLSW